MHTYTVEQVAGSWHLKSRSGEAILCVDDYDSAVELAKRIGQAGQATVVVIDANKRTSTLLRSSADGAYVETMLTA